MNIIGIDGGLSGGIAVLDSTTNIVTNTYKMPTKKHNKKVVIDCNELLNILKTISTNPSTVTNNIVTTVVIEDIFIGKGMSCKSSITTISNFGMILCCCRLLNIEPVIVGPSTWQSYIFRGIVIDSNLLALVGNNVIKDSKLKSLQVAQLLGYVGTNDGISDACCIASYYYLNYLK
jgi:hypothetical protein